MTDKTIQRIRKFKEDRDWERFHSPANLAKSISIEANELLECFQWSDTDYDMKAVKEELADVLVYCRHMLDRLGLDEDEIVNAKMDKNEAKYPVEKAKGVSTKYDKLDQGKGTYIEPEWLRAMTSEEWKAALARRLTEIFGKNIFTENELTKEFYVELRVGCSEFFQTENNTFDQDLFWSEGLRNWLLGDRQPN